MKMIMTIFVLIITLALSGLVLIFLKSKDKNINDIAIWIQAVATIVLVIVTWLYVNEARLSRISQEEGFKKYVTELQEARKQQVKPYVYVLFYWGGERFGSKFFTVLKNVGAGPAFDINYSYSVVDDKGQLIRYKDKCDILAAGSETADDTPFSTEHINIKNKVKIEISYKDSFDEIFTNSFDLSLKELANNPPPCDFAEHIRKISREVDAFDREHQVETFLQTFKTLQQDISEIKDSLKKQDR